jgi:tRNA pseudouridine13 synthase
VSDPTEIIPGVRPGYLTGDVPPIGGEIRARIEDFLVDEEPLYQPSGEGEHIYLFVEKRGRSTHQAVDALARHFGVERRAVGYAGLKDTRAITRQVFSVHTPGKSFKDYPDFGDEHMSVLWADMHTNKLRVGHLRGNRFSIRIRGVRAVDARSALRVVDRLEREGVPNLLGEQRFGARANNHEVARLDLLERYGEMLDALIGPGETEPEGDQLGAAREAYARGDYAGALAQTPRYFEAESAALRTLAKGGDAAKAVRAIPSRDRQFWMNALQSFVFNKVVSERLAAGTLGAVVPGDLAWKHDNGAVFAVDEATGADAETKARAARFEISPSGPIWGPKMTLASGETDRVEVEALAGTGVTIEHIAAWEKRTKTPAPGARRPLRIPLLDPDVEGGADEHGEYVRVAFELPAGSYATVVLREIMKPERANASVAPA